jgi:hypothetical protein
MAKAKKRTKKRKAHKQVRRVAKAKKRSAKPATRKRRKRTVSVKKKTPVKRKRKRSQGRKLVKQVEKQSVERVMAGRKRKRRKRRVRMAGPVRRRTVGKSGNSGLLLGLAIGAGALYLLTRGAGSATTSPYGSLPPLTQTGNYTRDTQSQQIVNYALAAGLTINAITSLINSLNASSDNTVNNVYDKVNTTGSLTDLGLPGYDPIA